MGGLEKWVPVPPHVAIALVVCEDKENVGFRVSGRVQREHRKQGDEK
jgi:hypothetical protein